MSGPLVAAQRSVNVCRAALQAAQRERDTLIRDAVVTGRMTEREVATLLRLSTGRVHNIVATVPLAGGGDDIRHPHQRQRQRRSGLTP